MISAGRKNADGPGYFFVGIIAEKKNKYQGAAAFTENTGAGTECEYETQFEKVEDLIKTEVNVKDICVPGRRQCFISKKIKPNYVALGKKLGPKMKAVAAALANFTQEDIAKLEKEGSNSLLIENEPVILQVTDVEITSEDIPGWMVANKGNLTVALDVTVTPELVEEGNAREIVNRIQKIRKDNGYELTDRILVQLTQPEELAALSISLITIFAPKFWQISWILCPKSPMALKLK